uniref:Uncharacterized protein n=2 Tax=Rhizochromulina marina TaxID=1034831 RepID=A0A7S2SFH9_9STRA|mmetsp:Transcript_29424/g.85784  ORF Transcript_29424/g.85784 Transcript_29424/m.85784 type:complete len:467 (+) Transcript_29424:3-1403(+)
MPPLVPPSHSYFAGFALSAAAMLLALVIFLSGSRYYRDQKPDMSALRRCINAVRIAVTTPAGSGRECLWWRTLGLGWRGVSGVLRTLAVLPPPGVRFFLGLACCALAFLVSLAHPIAHLVLAVPGGALQELAQASVLLCGILLVAAVLLLFPVTLRPVWLAVGPSSAQESCQDPRGVKDAYDMVRCLPTAMVLTAMWAAQGFGDGINQNILQQTDMRLWSACDAQQIPGPMISLLDPLVCLASIPVLESKVYPMCGGRPPIMTRITYGIACALASVSYTCFFEQYRKSAPVIQCPTGPGSEMGPLLGDTGAQPLSQISFMWMAPPYMLMSIGQSLISPACYELYYCEVAAGLRSMCFAVNMLTWSFGAMLESLIYRFWAHDITNDLNNGHAEFPQFTAAALLAVALTAHVNIVAPRFQSLEETSVTMRSLFTQGPEQEPFLDGQDNEAFAEADEDLTSRKSPRGPW